MTGPRYRRRPDVLWRRSLDAVVLLPAGEREPVTLAATGPEVWELLADWRTLDELAGVLAARYRVDVDAVGADLAPILTTLQAIEALELAADSGDPGAK